MVYIMYIYIFIHIYIYLHLVDFYGESRYMPYIHGSCGNIPGSSGIYNKKHPKQSYCKNI